MQPYFALLTLRAMSVLVAPGPDEGCPSARQVSAALETRAPAAQRVLGPNAEDALTLVLPAPGSPQEPSFSLIDQQGRLRLFRTLARPSSAHGRDCVALSDTVALIVQRYFEEVELPEEKAASKNPAIQAAAPSTPPAPAPVVPSSRSLARARWDFSLGISERIGNETGGLEPYDLRLSVARTLGGRMDMGLLVALWSGISGWTSHEWNGGHGQLIRVPSGLALMWRRAVSTVELQLGLAGLLDCWILDATYQTNTKRDYRFSFAGAASGGLQVPLGKRVFARVFLDFALAAVRPEYFDSTLSGTAAFSTPAVFGDAGFAFGMSLR